MKQELSNREKWTLVLLLPIFTAWVTGAVVLKELLWFLYLDYSNPDILLLLSYVGLFALVQSALLKIMLWQIK